MYEMPGAQHYDACLHPHDYDQDHEAITSTVHDPFDQFMANWLPLNRAIKDGRAPRALLNQAAFVSSVMPDMSNPTQLRHYGHLMDLTNEGLDPVTPSPDHVNEFIRRANGGEPPQWNRPYYEINSTSKINKSLGDLPQLEGFKNLTTTQGKISQLAHVHRTNGAAPDWAKNGINRFGLSLLGVGNTPVYDHYGKATDDDHQATDELMGGHPALAHILNSYPVFQEDPDQALLPAVLLHRLVAPHHENMTETGKHAGASQKAFLSDLADVYQRNGIHSGIAKAETPVIHGRALRALEETRQRHGTTAALLGYHLYAVPALLAADQGAALLKMEVIVELLKKNTNEVYHKDPKFVKFLGQTVVPGLARSPKGDYHILAESPTHYLGMPAQGEGIVQLPKKKEGTHYQIVSPFKSVSNNMLDADTHGVNAFNTTPEQRDLFHNADLTKWHRNKPKHAEGIGGGALASSWVKSPKGNRPAIIKSDFLNSLRHEGEMEGLFHNMARDFFGLGRYVPTTAVFDHPEGRRYSIQLSVPYAEHAKNPYDDKAFSDKQRSTLSQLHRSGDLDKLALMDGLMGSTDRHGFNYLFSRNDGFHLIDNSRILDMGYHHMPHYWEKYHSPSGIAVKNDPGNSGLNAPLHPETVQWALNLDPDKFRDHLQQYGQKFVRNPFMVYDENKELKPIPQSSAAVEMPKRLRALQELLHSTRGNVSRVKAYQSTLHNALQDDTMGPM